MHMSSDALTTAVATIVGAVVGGGAVMGAASRESQRENRGAVAQILSLLTAIEFECLQVVKNRRTQLPVKLIRDLLRATYSAEASRALLACKQISAFYDDLSALRSFSNEATLADVSSIDLPRRIVSRCSIARLRLGDRRRVTVPTTVQEAVGIRERISGAFLAIATSMTFAGIVFTMIVGLLSRIRVVSESLFDGKILIVMLVFFLGGAAYALWRFGWRPPPAKFIRKRAVERRRETLAALGRSLVFLLALGLMITTFPALQLQLGENELRAGAPLMMIAFIESQLMDTFIVFIVVMLLGWCLFVYFRVRRWLSLDAAVREVDALNIDGVCSKYPGSPNILTIDFCHCTGAECAAKRMRI